MAWRLFNWGSRGATYDTGGGVYVPVILIPHCVQLNIDGHTITGEELVMVFDVETTSALPTSVDVVDIAGAANDWVNSTFLANLATDLTTVDQVVATSRAEVDGPQSTIYNGGLGLRGASLGEIHLPNNVTIALKKSTGRAGRSYRGRTYAWPMLGNDLESGIPNEITATFATLLFSTYNALKTSLALVGYQLGVASNVLATITSPIDFILVDKTIDSQRRRLPGRGA